MKKDTSQGTLLVITLGFIMLFLWLKQEWALYTALAVGIIGVASPWVASRIEWLWFRLAFMLNKIIPTILLTAIFYLILFPLSLVSKLFTKDPLLLKNNGKTTFRDVAKTDVRESMEKTW